MNVLLKRKNKIFFICKLSVIFSFSEIFCLDFSYNGALTQTYLQTTGNQSDKDSATFPNTDEGSWKFTEMLIGGSFEINEKLRVGAQAISKVYGNYGNYDLALDWGYADYQYSEYLGLRLGKVKYALGIYNESRDVDSARTSILLSQGIYDESNRSFVTAANGTSLYGSFEKDKFGILDYQFTLGNVDIPKDFIMNEFLGVNGLWDSGRFEGKWVAGLHVEYTAPWGSVLEGLKLGLSHSEFRGDAAITTISSSPNVPSQYDFTYDVSTTVFSAEYTQYDFVLGGEFMFRQLGPEIPDSVVSNYFADNNFTAGGTWNGLLDALTQDQRAYYLYGSYQLTEKASTQLMWSSVDHRNRSEKDSDIYTLSHRYDWTENIVTKTEFHHVYDENGQWGLFLARIGYTF